MCRKPQFMTHLKQGYVFLAGFCPNLPGIAGLQPETKGSGEHFSACHKLWLLTHQNGPKSQTKQWIFTHCVDREQIAGASFVRRRAHSCR